MSQEQSDIFSGSYMLNEGVEKSPSKDAQEPKEHRDTKDSRASGKASPPRCSSVPSTPKGM